MSEYNPYFMDGITGNDSGSSFMLLPKGGEVKPLQYFGRYNFQTPQAAAEFIQTPNFTEFWDRNNAGLKNIGIRAEINDSGRYNDPRIRQTYSQEMDVANRIRVRNLSKGVDPNIVEQNFDNASVSARSAGRFYTQQGLPTSIKDTSFYLNNQNATSRPEPQPYPVRVIADKRISRFSLSDKPNWNGAYPEGITVSEAMNLNKARDLSRSVGTDLGASLSSNTRSEAFVSSQMASQESRYAGRVNDNGTVTLIGKPKTSVPLQTAGNILNAAGNFMNYASIIPIVTSELERKRSDYQNPITQEYFTKDKVVNLDGVNYESATPEQIAMFHPDNAAEHPEITDEMRKKFYPKWFE